MQSAGGAMFPLVVGSGQDAPTGPGGCVQILTAHRRKVVPPEAQSGGEASGRKQIPLARHGKGSSSIGCIPQVGGGNNSNQTELPDANYLHFRQRRRQKRWSHASDGRRSFRADAMTTVGTSGQARGSGFKRSFPKSRSEGKKLEFELACI